MRSYVTIFLTIMLVGRVALALDIVAVCLTEGGSLELKIHGAAGKAILKHIDAGRCIAYGANEKFLATLISSDDAHPDRTICTVYNYNLDIVISHATNIEAYRPMALLNNRPLRALHLSKNGKYVYYVSKAMAEANDILDYVGIDVQTGEVEAHRLSVGSRALYGLDGDLLFVQKNGSVSKFSFNGTGNLKHTAVKAMPSLPFGSTFISPIGVVSVENEVWQRIADTELMPVKVTPMGKMPMIAVRGSGSVDKPIAVFASPLPKGTQFQYYDAKTGKVTAKFEVPVGVSQFEVSADGDTLLLRDTDRSHWYLYAHKATQLTSLDFAGTQSVIDVFVQF